VLDLGCGTGDPIAAYLAGRGLHVVGLDQSHAMLAIARTRYPDGDWRHGDMRTLDLPERFDGMLGWNSFFHLRPDEQRALLPRLAAHLAPGGSLMLTVGPRDSEAVGHVGGEPVYHSSLAPDAYAGLLAGLGLGLVAFVAEDPECDFQSVLLARRTP
jgi:trans-aconitate methyltransferase